MFGETYRISYRFVIILSSNWRNSDDLFTNLCICGYYFRTYSLCKRVCFVKCEFKIVEVQKNPVHRIQATSVYARRCVLFNTQYYRKYLHWTIKTTLQWFIFLNIHNVIDNITGWSPFIAEYTHQLTMRTSTTHWYSSCRHS